MTKKAKRIYAALAGVFLLALYFIIFIFSSQDGETSGGVSFQISLFGVETWNDVANRGWSEFICREWAEVFEHPIRKLAHFSEFAAMGFLQYSLLRSLLGKKKWLFWATALWLVISAAADEVHQLFVPGRWGSVSDVIIDTGGGIFGVLVCLITISFYKKIVFNRAKRT